MEIQHISLHTFNSGDIYYKVHEDTLSLAVEIVDQVHDSNPFPRESIRVSISGATGVTRLMTDDVSSYITFLFFCGIIIICPEGVGQL